MNYMQKLSSLKKDNKCFQYTVTVTLNHEEIKKYQQRTTKLKSFIDKYIWEGTNYPSKKMIGKFEKNNLVNVFKIFHDENEEIYVVYVSKQSMKK